MHHRLHTRAMWRASCSSRTPTHKYCIFITVVSRLGRTRFVWRSRQPQSATPLRTLSVEGQLFVPHLNTYRMQVALLLAARRAAQYLFRCLGNRNPPPFRHPCNVEGHLSVPKRTHLHAAPILGASYAPRACPGAVGRTCCRNGLPKVSQEVSPEHVVESVARKCRRRCRRECAQRCLILCLRCFCWF